MKEKGKIQVVNEILLKEVEIDQKPQEEKANQEDK